GHSRNCTALYESGPCSGGLIYFRIGASCLRLLRSGASPGGSWSRPTWMSPIRGIFAAGWASAASDASARPRARTTASPISGMLPGSLADHYDAHQRPLDEYRGTGLPQWATSSRLAQAIRSPCPPAPAPTAG